MEWSILLQAFLMIFLAEMGDKSQFLMAAMTAHYRTRDILIGTGCAICVLNLLAVLVGSAIGRFLPTAVISLVAGFAFLAFAYLGVRESETEEERVRRGKRAIPAIFGTYFLAELGDKTQLAVMTLSADGRCSRGQVLATLIGASLGLFLSGLIGLLVGALLGRRLPATVFSRISSLLFFGCGAVRLLQGFEHLFAATPYPTLLATVATILPVLFVVLLAWKGSSYHAQDHPSRAKSIPVQPRQ